MLRRTSLKPRAKRKSAAMRRYHDWVARRGCCVCGGPATVHHVSASIHGGRVARSDMRVAPLCPEHHQIQFGPRFSVEALGHRGFLAEHGVDLPALADMLWASYERREG